MNNLKIIRKYRRAWFINITQKYFFTGRERLIRSHSSARFCFELSGNSN